MSIALNQGKMKFRLPSPPSPVTPNHPAAVAVNPDASHSFAAPDSYGHARHERRGRGGSFGSAVRPRVAPRAPPVRHSRQHNRSGPDPSHLTLPLQHRNRPTTTNRPPFPPR